MILKPGYSLTRKDVAAGLPGLVLINCLSSTVNVIDVSVSTDKATVRIVWHSSG